MSRRLAISLPIACAPLGNSRRSRFQSPGAAEGWGRNSGREVRNGQRTCRNPAWGQGELHVRSGRSAFSRDARVDQRPAAAQRSPGLALSRPRDRSRDAEVDHRVGRWWGQVRPPRPRAPQPRGVAVRSAPGSARSAARPPAACSAPGASRVPVGRTYGGRGPDGLAPGWAERSGCGSGGRDPNGLRPGWAGRLGCGRGRRVGRAAAGAVGAVGLGHQTG